MSTSEENKKSLTERDVCTKFITPALVAAGWDLQSQLREEVTFTAGRVIVRGSQVTRGEARRADFVLYHIKNPNAEAAKHGDPDELLADYKQLLVEVAAARDALRNELAKALESAQ